MSDKCIFRCSACKEYWIGGNPQHEHEVLMKMSCVYCGSDNEIVWKVLRKIFDK